ETTVPAALALTPPAATPGTVAASVGLGYEPASVPPAAPLGGPGSAAIWLALWPSTWSAFRPVATPFALVVNGLALGWGVVPLPTLIWPATPPAVTNSNA